MTGGQVVMREVHRIKRRADVVKIDGINVARTRDLVDMQMRHGSAIMSGRKRPALPCHNHKQSYCAVEIQLHP
jgi:hypothetical protein